MGPNINDPNTIIEIAAGPPAPELVPQKKGEGLEFGRQYSNEIKRFIFKKAHMSKDDFRIFDKDGRLVCNAWHEGKNPYGDLDPLGLGNTGPKQEWESLCKAQGYHGVPGFKVKPKMASSHGRQFIQSWDNRTVYLSIAKESRLKNMSVRHNLEVCKGANGEKVLSVLVDLAGRTMQFKNEKDELVGFAQKSVKTLVMNAALGSGSEMILDVAPGMDWSVIVACIIGVQQVGAHILKDMVGNFVAPQVQDAALQAAGLDGVANQLGGVSDQLVNKVRWGQNLLNMYNNA